MPDQLTLDVIDRPATGLVAATRRVYRLRRNGSVPGLRAVIPLSTGHFVERVKPSPTPRRIGVLTVWEDGADVDARWQDVMAPLADGAGEHWHVRGELARAAFSEPWRGWTPQADGATPLADDEPALILISGNLKARWIGPFLRDAAGVVVQANRDAGYLGGLAIQSSPLNTTSCSAWRTYADAKRFAYASGAHQAAMKRDRAEEHHRTEYFTRIRPLAERGTLDGAAPFAEVLGAQPVGVTR